MALDKAVDSAALDAGLNSVADAIRTKGGTAEPLAWPEGFAAAIAAIETGTGGVSLDDVDVYVADYYYDEVAVTAGALDVYKRVIVS